MKTNGRYAGEDIPLIGQQLRTCRDQMGITQQELADRVGITKGALSAYELDKIRPGEDKLVLLAKILKVTPEFLCGWEEGPSDIEDHSNADGEEPDGEEFRRLSKIVDRQRGIGRQIKRLREERGISTGMLAGQLGISEELLGMFEKDLKYPAYEVLVKMSEELNVSTEELLGIDTGKIINIGNLSDDNRKLIKNIVQSMK